MIRNLFISAFIIVTSVAITYAQQNAEYKAFFYPNGKISSEGYMLNGKPDGLWKSYYPTGILKSVGKRRNTILDSTWLFYTQSGNISEIINYHNGNKNGYFITYAENPYSPNLEPVIISKELYVNDVRQGISYYFDNYGNLTETIPYEEGVKQGTAYEFNKDSIIVTIKTYNKGYLIERERINRTNSKGEKVGVWKEFHENGKTKAEITYVEGKKSGLSKQYTKEGELFASIYYKGDSLISKEFGDNRRYIIKEVLKPDTNLKDVGPYLDSIPVGIHRIYNQNGEIVDGLIYDDKGNLLEEGIVDKNGNRQGDWIVYFTDKSIKAKGSYSNDLKTGNWIYYHKNGSVEQKGEYRNNNPVGHWLWYYANGNIFREENYMNGFREGIFAEYNENGELILEGEYFDGEREGEWTIKVGDQITKGSYVTGLKNGKWQSFYTDGSISYDGNFVQGSPDGWHRLYYANGNLMEERYYVMGFKEKNWKMYDKTGVMLYVVTYKNNEELKFNGVTNVNEKDDAKEL